MSSKCSRPSRFPRILMYKDATLLIATINISLCLATLVQLLASIIVDLTE